MISQLEDQLKPRGRVDLIGLGRLGLKTGLNLIQVHRGGPKEIAAFDGQKISPSDIIFTLNGAQPGTYKTDFLKKLCTHDPDFRNIISIKKDINTDNIDLIKGDVVIIEIAGGNTIPIAAEIIKHVHSYGGKTIGTGGIFGLTTENITIKDISQYSNNNPVVDELRKEGIHEDHLIISTNTFIKDKQPITPYVLDKIADKITEHALRLL